MIKQAHHPEVLGAAERGATPKAGSAPDAINQSINQLGISTRQIHTVRRPHPEVLGAAGQRDGVAVEVGADGQADVPQAGLEAAQGEVGMAGQGPGLHTHSTTREPVFDTADSDVARQT